MGILKTLTSTFAVTCLLVLSTQAQANPTMTSAVNGASGTPHFDTSTPLWNTRHVGDRFLDGSETATFFYKKGVRLFEKGDFDSAKTAFRATLRANGLDRLSLHYLVIISHNQGDMSAAENYTQAYIELDKA